jgi:hypothetical protein
LLAKIRSSQENACTSLMIAERCRIRRRHG